MKQKMLAEKVHGIHFIINGHLTHAQADPVLVERSQIFLAGSRGEYFGQVDLFKKEKETLLPVPADRHEAELSRRSPKFRPGSPNSRTNCSVPSSPRRQLTSLPR